MEPKPCCTNLEQEFACFARRKGIETTSKGQLLIWLGLKLRQVRQVISSSFSLYPESLISSHLDRQGNPYYHLYDPIERAHHTFTSEESIRIWLEQRHYR